MFAPIRALIGRLILAAFRLRVVDEDPGAHRPLVIGAPHTSYIDGLLLLALVWRMGYNVRAMVEQRFFVGPFDRLLRALGAIPIDRKNPIGVIEHFTALLADPKVMLVMAPEGTRSARQTWKSGFYRIARAAGVPVALGYVDMSRRETGLGPTIHLTGDVAADMDRIRAFYAGKRGVRAGLESQVRLSREPHDDREWGPRRAS